MSITWEMDAFVSGSTVVGVIVDVSTRRVVASRVIPTLGDIRGLLTEALGAGAVPDAVLIDSRPGWLGAISAVLAERGIAVRVANPRDAARKGIAERIARQLRDGRSPA